MHQQRTNCLRTFSNITGFKIIPGGDRARARARRVGGGALVRARAGERPAPLAVVGFDWRGGRVTCERLRRPPKKKKKNYPWKEKSPKPTPLSASLRTKYSRISSEDTQKSSEVSIKVFLCFVSARIVKILLFRVRVCLSV